MGINIYPIPGPSSITALISISGILANNFVFIGFFPKKMEEAKKIVLNSSKLDIPILFFETSKRLVKTLQFLEELYEIEAILVAKELTKIFECHYFGPINKILEELSSSSLKGEWAVFVKLKNKQETSVQDTVDKLLEAGLNDRQIINITKTIFKLPRKKVYNYLLENKGL
jgi:16S rRNA (cytidine1402-2'-O)-methyltransferase